jgi:AcrR family transcriptional regulator
MTQPDARQRIVIGAADMLARRGLTATSVRELAKHSNAPLGSTYHYFPGGKQQLASEAVRYAGDSVSRALAKRLAAGPVEGLRAFLALWRKTVMDSDFRAGCPVLAVAVEEPADETATEAVTAAADVFTAWQKLLADSLAAHGATTTQARQVATLIVAAVEGTVGMCRATRDIGPLDDVAAQLEAVVTAAIAD